jgi:hypothetical protein
LNSGSKPSLSAASAVPTATIRIIRKIRFMPQYCQRSCEIARQN